MKKIFLHPLPLRIWHGVNAVTILLLLWTGFQFRIPEIDFLLPRDTAVALHRWAGIAMAALWIFWLIYGLAGGALRRHYALRRSDLGGSAAQMKFYLISIFKGGENPFEPTPDAKFNPLQKWAYLSMMVIMTPVMILTGLLYAHAFSIGGYRLSVTAVKILDILHVAGLYGFALFLVLHIYMATIGVNTLTHIKAMIVGYEERADDPAQSGMNSEAETETTGKEGKEKP